MTLKAGIRKGEEEEDYDGHDECLNAISFGKRREKTNNYEHFKY